MPSDPASKGEAAICDQWSQLSTSKLQDEALKAEIRPTLSIDDSDPNLRCVQTPSDVVAIQRIHQQERQDSVSKTQQVHSPDSGLLLSKYGDVSICDRSRGQFVLPKSACEHASADLSQLRLCLVDILMPAIQGSPFTNLTIRHVKKSLLKCGRVYGPAFIANAEDSVVVVACKQLRVHESSHCVFYLHCESRPIIENCTGIKFAPLPKSLVMSSWIFTYQEVESSRSLTLGNPLVGATTLSYWDQPLVSD